MTRATRSVSSYPAPPGAAASPTHRVRVDGSPVFVERYAGVGYARFATRGPVRVEISVESPILSHAAFPAERVAAASVAGNVLRLELPAPEAAVVWIDRLEPLIVLPDAVDPDEPVAGSAGVYDVAESGADPSGRAIATAAIQAAIDRAGSLAGGGTVLVPRGRFLTGTLALRSGVRLYLAPGALLQGSSDPRDYPIDPGRRESAADEHLAADARFLGRTMTFSRLVLVDRAEHVTIAGRGTIDGAGSTLRPLGAAPNLLRVRQSADVRVHDVLFRNAAAWTIHLLASRTVAVENVKVVNDRTTLNTDGIDPDMSTDVTIDRAFVYTKDDGICVKATGNSDLSGEPRRIAVTNCLVSSLDAALKVGTESEAERFADIRFEHDHVFDSGRAMSIVVRDGAAYEDVSFRHIRVGPRVDHLVEQVIGVRSPQAGLGAIRRLTFDDVQAPSFARPARNWTWYAQFRPGAPGPDDAVDVFEGADRLHALDGLVIRNVVVNGVHLSDTAVARDVAGLTIGAHVRHVSFE